MSKVTGVVQLVSALEAENTALKAQRDALLAQVETMRSAMSNACNVTNLAESGDQANAVYMMESVLRKTPQQCLRDVWAEAGRAGYVAGVNAISHAKTFGVKFDRDARANEYAESVRKGGAE